MAKLTYFKKELKECPICNAKFQEEIMFTGGMRQVSVTLTNELRTIYKLFNGKPVAPFIYEVMTCPKCLYSALNMDFDEIYPKIGGISASDKRMETVIEKKRLVLKDLNIRKDMIKDIPDVLFTAEKNINTGLAAYILAEKCYDYFNEKQLPIVKKAMCSIRAAWLASDLNMEELSKDYYKKARNYYGEFTSGTDNTTGIKIGPDWGNNFGFDGARFLKALLDIKFLNEIENLKEKFEVLSSVRTTLSRLRGYGKASKDKVGPLLRLTEEMFELISPQYDKLKKLLEEQGENIDESNIDKKEFEINIKKEEIPEAAVETVDGSAETEETEESEEDDNYHKVAIEIVKYGIRNGIKKDSVSDIMKILKNYF